jgi:uncharacterized protein (TIGR02996 family)
MTSEREALLALVIAAPDDDGPRLVYADALLEANDPRGRFITGQIALAGKLSKNARRVLKKESEALLDAHREAWCSPAQRARIAPEVCTFRRGFIDEVTADAAAFAAQGRALASMEPVQRITLTEGSAEAIEQLVGENLLDPMKALTIKGEIGDHGASALSTSPSLARLLRLNLDFQMIGPEGISALLGGDNLRACRILALTGNPIGSAGLAALAKSPNLGALEVLYLARSEIDDDGLAALASSTTLSNLKTIGLDYNAAVSDEGVDRLTTSETLVRLSKIELAGTASAYPTRLEIDRNRTGSGPRPRRAGGLAPPITRQDRS